MSVPRVTAKMPVTRAFLSRNCDVSANSNVPGTGAVRRRRRDSLSRIYQFAERFRLENDGPAVPQLQNSPALPIAKTAIDLLARTAGHFRQFALREGELQRAATLRLVRQQRLGEPHRQIKERNIGHALVRTANPRTESP